jgi:hypothetical protein
MFSFYVTRIPEGGPDRRSSNAAIGIEAQWIRGSRLMRSQSTEAPLPIKMVGANGQISLGKEFAGQQVQVEQREPGVWLVRAVVVVPANELWLHAPDASASLDRAVTWAQANPPRQSDLSELEGVINDGPAVTQKAPGTGNTAKSGSARQRRG